MGADPVALATSMFSYFTNEKPPLQTFSVRKAAKAHGQTKLIEGNFKAGDSVVVIDDVVTRGDSTLAAIEALLKEEAKIAFVAVLVDRQEGGRQKIEQLGYQVVSAFKKDELIFREGDPANRFYLIRQGRVELETEIKDRGRMLIQTIGPGDVLGWSWLFEPYYWHFDARALSPVKAIFFYGTPLRQQCEEDPHLGYELMKRVAEVVIKRLQAARKHLIEVGDRAYRGNRGIHDNLTRW